MIDPVFMRSQKYGGEGSTLGLSKEREQVGMYWNIPDAGGGFRRLYVPGAALQGGMYVDLIVFKIDIYPITFRNSFPGTRTG